MVANGVAGRVGLHEPIFQILDDAYHAATPLPLPAGVARGREHAPVRRLTAGIGREASWTESLSS